MRILWVSNSPHVGTGYGVQTRLFAPRLQEAGHDVAILGFYGEECSIRDWNGIPLYPRLQHPYAQDAIPIWAAHWRADIVITLIDAWVYDPTQWGKDLKWCPWFPVDCEPLDPAVGNAIQHAFERINFSQHGHRLTQARNLTSLYVPHGVETGVFSPGSQEEARKRLGWGTDKCIFGMVAANKGYPSRKAFAEVLHAFSAFRHERPDSLLYMHSCPDVRYGGLPLMDLVALHGLQDCVRFQDPNLAILGYPDEYMADVYRAIDCLVSPSYGEGFGVPILEAQACGKPVITGDWTAMSELTFAGWKIAKETAHPFMTPHMTYQYMPNIPAIANALLEAYDARGNKEIAAQARGGAIAYDADEVAAKYWIPALKQIEAMPSWSERRERAALLQSRMQEAVA